MSITAADIQNQVFEHSKHGYDVDQVDEFLSRLEAEVNSFQEQLDAAQQRHAELQARLDEAQTRYADYERRLSEHHQDDSVISNAIISAQRSAEAIKKEAREAGDKVYREAEAKSRDILRDALAEKQKTLEEIDRLKSSRDSFRLDYLALLQKFVKQAEETFPESFAPTAAATSAAATPAPAAANDALGATISAAPVEAPATYGAAAELDADELD